MGMRRRRCSVERGRVAIRVHSDDATHGLRVRIAAGDGAPKLAVAPADHDAATGYPEQRASACYRHTLARQVLVNVDRFETYLRDGALDRHRWSAAHVRARWQRFAARHAKPAETESA